MNILHTNTEDEMIEIAEVSVGAFKGQFILILHDDLEVSATKAMTLLDDGTVDWLLEKLTQLKNKKVLA